MIEIGDNDLVLICGAIHQAEEIPNSDRIVATCGHEAAIAPSGRKVLAETNRKAITICLACAVQHPKVREGLRERGAYLTPHQRHELNKVIGVADVDQAMARFRIQEREID